MFIAMKATLEDAEEKQFSNKATKDQVRKLKNAAYELDHIMDEYVISANFKCFIYEKV